VHAGVRAGIGASRAVLRGSKWQLFSATLGRAERQGFESRPYPNSFKKLGRSIFPFIFIHLRAVYTVYQFFQIFPVPARNRYQTDTKALQNSKTDGRETHTPPSKPLLSTVSIAAIR
jgi:hypothetical protein